MRHTHKPRHGNARGSHKAGVLRSVPTPSKADPTTSEPAMTAILTILVFLVVVGALNVFEFGRLD